MGVCCLRRVGVFVFRVIVVGCLLVVGVLYLVLLIVLFSGR